MSTRAGGYHVEWGLEPLWLLLTTQGHTFSNLKNLCFSFCKTNFFFVRGRRFWTT